MAGSKAQEARGPYPLHPGGITGRLSGLRDSKKGPGLSFKDADTQLMAEALDAAIDDGAFVGISRTSDGGALCILVKSDVEKEKLYITDADELTHAWQVIRDAFG